MNASRVQQRDGANVILVLLTSGEEKLLLLFNSFILMKDDNARRLLQNKRGERKGNVLGPVSNGQTKELKAYGGSNSPKMPGDLERNGKVSKSY